MMESIEYIVGNADLLNNISEVSAWRPFDERAIGFCETISGALLKLENVRQYPDLVTLAFWLRKSNIRSIKNRYNDLNDNLGRGLVFHIAPGNVPLSFAYSLFTGLLTGNTNIIRLPSRRFDQADLFCGVLRAAIMQNSEMEERICLIKYPHDKSITDKLSLKCHTRIIWGGDETVNTIRQSPILPRTTEITFANRFSVCIINGEKYLLDYDPKKTAHDFYIDTYLTDQNACSSPRIIFWTGRKIEEAKKVFWEALYKEIQGYDIAPVTTVDKLLTYCKYASENDCHMTTNHDYKIMRVQIPKLTGAVTENIGNSGYFYECDVVDISEILPICTWTLQTISHVGMDAESIHEMILFNAPHGVDRIVPVGHTMDFGFIWDGRDIIREMTRKIAMQ